MELAKLEEFERSYAAAWCSQDPDRVAAYFSERGSLAVNGGRPAIGREAIAQIAQGFMRDFPDMIVTMDAIKPTLEGAVFHWTLTGTKSDPAGTGKRVCISGYEVWKIGADGLVAQSDGHFDEKAYEYQLRYGAA